MIKNIILILLLLQSFNSAAKSNLTTAGDITQIAIPLTGFSMALYKDDEQGKKQFIKSFIVNLGLVYSLKYAVNNTQWGERPNGGDHSFPSGHSASAFQGAFFIQKRYGHEYGVPAIALAGFTGYTRVRGDYHHWRDVIGGAAIAFGVNYFFVTNYKEQPLVATINKNEYMLSSKVNF